MLGRWAALVLLLALLASPAPPLSCSLRGLAGATEISFQRGGDDDSLPLSQKYRANLRRLCELLKKAEASNNPSLLPAELRAKKDSLVASCAKLHKDDLMELHGETAITSKRSLLIASAATGAVGVLVLFGRRVLATLRRWFAFAAPPWRAPPPKPLDPSAPSAPLSEEDKDRAREARLKRFAGEISSAPEQPLA